MTVGGVLCCGSPELAGRADVAKLTRGTVELFCGCGPVAVPPVLAASQFFVFFFLYVEK